MNHGKHLSSATYQQFVLALFDCPDDEDGTANCKVLPCSASHVAAVAHSPICNQLAVVQLTQPASSEPVDKAVTADVAAKAAPTTTREEPDADDPKSAAYRFRDTGYIAASRKEMAASQVIQSGRRDGILVTLSVINWEELERNPREAKNLITKSNLFGLVGWDALRAAGMEPGAGFLVDRVYSAIGQEPDEDHPQARKDYTLGLQVLRERLEAAKTPMDVVDVVDALADEYDGAILSDEETAQCKELGKTADTLLAEERTLQAKIDESYEQSLTAGGPYGEARREVERRERRGWAVKPELEASLAAAKVVADAANQEYCNVRGELAPRKAAAREARSAIGKQVEQIRAAARIRNKIENPVHRAWTLMGERFAKVLRFRSPRHGSEAFAKHVTAAKRGSIKDWSWMEKEVMRAPRVTTESVRFQLRVADQFERVGGRAVAPQSTAELKELFELREVQSGNWVLRDFTAAQFNVEQSGAALADLADLFGVDDKRLSLGGRLALAFGARGQGAKGKSGAARAHYETVHRVINLTKMGGGGSLGHEWFHALDNMIGEVLTGLPAGVSDFVTKSPEILPAGELREAVKALRAALLEGPYQATQVMSYSAKDVRLAGQNLTNYSSVGIARTIMVSRDVHDAVRAVEAQYGAKPGEKLEGRAKTRYGQWRGIALAHFGGNPDGGEIEVRSGPLMSSFALEALKLDQGSTSYWREIHEMAARAFQSWVEDRLAALERRNDFLSTYAENRFHVCPLTGIQWKPFPEGDERERINAAFDRLAEAIRETFTRSMS